MPEKRRCSMKNFTLRTFAVGLVLAGLASTSHANHNQASFPQLKAASERMPIPVCPPNDPNACNIDKW
jgi:hypothetical protein